MVTEPPFVQPSQYENIILRANQDGSAIVHLKDVARAEMGRKLYIDINRLNGMPAMPIVIAQQPGSNGIEVANGVRKTMENLKRTMPDGIEYAIPLDTTKFVRLSIKEVIITLFQAIFLVVLVVYLFLQSFRATTICIAAIFVSLIGAFAGMLAMGFSINLLTLFGIILAIGMVVDDAIVVVENVERNMVKKNLPPREATILAMEEIGTSLIAVVLVMASVFIPAAFLLGTTGQLYKQFAITIVVSVVISGFVALTLTPAMCVLILKPSTPPQRGLFAWFNRFFDRFTTAFGNGVVLMIKRMGVAVQDVYSAVQAQFGAITVSQFNQYSRVWNVVLQSDAPFRRTPADITRLYTRSENGQMVSLSAMATTEYVAGPDLVPHFNGFPAASVIGAAAPGYSSGEAIHVMEEVAREVLPAGFDFSWAGMAYEEKKSGGSPCGAKEREKRGVCLAPVGRASNRKT